MGKNFQAGRQSNRLFYLAIPPNMFVNVVRCARRRASSENGWTRVIVEKPFGHDLESSRELTRELRQYLSEDQIFRYSFFFAFWFNQSIFRFIRTLTLSIIIQNWSSFRWGACGESIGTSFLKSGIRAFMVQELHSQCSIYLFWRFWNRGKRQVSPIYLFTADNLMSLSRIRLMDNRCLPLIDISIIMESSGI